MVRKGTELTLGPYPEREADSVVEQYQADGWKAKKEPRPGRDGQFMVKATKL